MPATDDQLRDAYDHVVVLRSNSGTAKIHVPHADSTPAEPRALCGRRGPEYRQPPIDVYPPAWADWCDACCDIAAGELTAQQRSRDENTVWPGKPKKSES